MNMNILALLFVKYMQNSLADFDEYYVRRCILKQCSVWLNFYSKSYYSS